MAKESTELTTKGDGGFLSLYDGNMDSFALTIAENLGGGGMAPRDLPRIRIPSGGGNAWEVPTLGEPESQTSFQGVIVHWQTMRAYWPQSYEESEGEPPECTSDDGIMGTVFGACKNCEYNQFGTAEGGTKAGKACREVRALFVLAENDVLPYFVPMPPMSIKPVSDYMLRLTQKGIRFWEVVTEFKLEQDKNRANIRYSKAAPKLVRQLEGDERERMAQYVDVIRPTLQGIQLGRSDIPE